MEVKPPCVVCKTRVAVVLKRQACKRCADLTGAEGTRKDYGLPSVREAEFERKRFIKVWNKMRGEGAMVADIARKLGKHPKWVEKKATALRAAGFELAPPQSLSSRRKEPEKPIDRSTLQSKSNEHGGGKGGIAGCNCEPCLTTRRKYRNEWNNANKEKVKAYRLKSDIKRGRRKARPEPS